MATATKKRNRIFTIVEEMRVKGPYSVEGTNQRYDFAHEYPLPCETLTMIGGKQKTNRFILGCNTLDKQEQIKLGFPVERAPTDEERMLLTFVGATLSIPDGYPTLEQYVEEAPWFKDYTGTRPVNSRIIYEELDLDAQEEDAYQFEEMVTTAKGIILNEKSREKLMNLYRLSKPGGMVNVQTETRKIKLSLLDIAATNPDFVIKGIKAAADSMMVLVTKAIDYGILNIDIVGKLAMMKNGKPEPFADIPEMGGRKAKVERVVSYLDRDEAKAIRDDVREQVSLKDKEIIAQWKQEEEEGLTTDTTTEAE